MHQEYVYVLTLIRAISYTPAFVPAGESLGCCLMPEALASSLTSALLYRLQAWGNETKKSIMKIKMEAPLFVGLTDLFPLLHLAVLEEHAGTVEEHYCQ